MSQIAKLRWRCRRGMKELDILLLRYLEECYPSATTEEQIAFQQLLEMQDPDLYAYVVGREQPSDNTLTNVIQQITHYIA